MHFEVLENFSENYGQLINTPLYVFFFKFRKQVVSEIFKDKGTFIGIMGDMKTVIKCFHFHPSKHLSFLTV